ncbi:hypothetical protein WJX77_005316 [Trebouxia sp. C0004]
MERSEHPTSVHATPLSSDAEQQQLKEEGQLGTLSVTRLNANSERSSSNSESSGTGDGAIPDRNLVGETKHRYQYSRPVLLELRSKPECQKPPEDWDLSHGSELYEPAVTSSDVKASPSRPGPSTPGQPTPEGAEYLVQNRKDTWRGIVPLQSAVFLGNEGPIRSRLVDNGYHGEPDPAKGARSGPGPTAWNHQQVDAEQPAHPGPPANASRPARPMARKDSDQSERWNCGHPPGPDSWRGPPGLHGQGNGPEGKERQWGGRGPQPPTPAGPVAVPRAPPNRLPEREAPQARSLDRDWRSSKGRGGPPPGPSSKEWVDGYHNQPAEAAMRTAASSDHPESHPHNRASHDHAPRDHQRGSSRNNPAWMSDGGAAGAEDAAGLTAGARRAKDFESERQRMKEEWKKEKAQLKGITYQPVSMAEFMSDEDLEALKTDTNAEMPASAQSTNGQVSSASGLPVPPSAISQQKAEGSCLASFLGQVAQGSSLHAQPAQAFDFRALAQAAGQSQPQMPPMPKGVTTLEDLERHAGASGPTPPPGFARPGFPVGAHAPVAHSHNDEEHAASAPTAAAAMSPAQPVQAVTATSSPWASSGAPTAQDAASQDSGKTLLSLLSRSALASGPAEQPSRTAITPPPGFSAISKPQAHISWGTSPQLQGIWGAPSTATGGAQATWDAAIPLNTPGSNPPTTQQAAFAQLLQAGAAERPEARPSHQSHAVSNPFIQAARVPSSEVPDQPGSTKHEQAGAGLLGFDRRASSGAVQADVDVRRDQATSAAANPLLALLGQHRSSTSSSCHTGSKGEQDAQLQAFLQAQSGAYSWHPPQLASKPQMQAPLMQQQQHQYKPQPAPHGPNALLSQDLLRQLQLGQSSMQAVDARTYPQQPSAGAHAYQQATPAYLQGPRSAGLYGGHEQPHVQASSHYGQQHQVPFNLGGALPRASLGQYQGPVMGNQQLQQSHLPGEGFSYPSAGIQANHLLADSQQFRNPQPAGSQAYGNNDLASQMLLQRLQQQSYSQAPQGGAGLDRFFNPLAFSNAQNGRVPAIPNMPGSLSELEAMMARQ